jgi:hypothetical protein
VFGLTADRAACAARNMIVCCRSGETFYGWGTMSSQYLSLHCKVWVLLHAMHARPPCTRRLVIRAFQLRQMFAVLSRISVECRDSRK